MSQPTIAIVGAGHAGVEAAFALAAAGAAVTLFSNEPGLPYFRPRLIAVAFGQAAPDAIAIKPEAAYAKAGITLRHEPATEVDLQARTVNGQVFDGLIVSPGSHPFVPPFKGERTRAHTLWTLADALAIREAALPGKAITVIGGGVLGLEAALRAAEAGLRVTVVESAPFLAGGVLGDCEATLRRALEAKGIALSVGVGVAEITAEGLSLADGRVIADDLLLCSTGARPNGPAAGTEGYLKTGGDLSLAPCVYAAGDPAEPPASRPTCSVRRAQLMGQLAAKNLLAELAGQPTQPWADPRLPLFMKVGDVEFHTLGDVRSPGLLEKCVEETPPFVRKTILRRGDQVVGLRWVGTRAGFADWEKQLA